MKTSAENIPLSCLKWLIEKDELKKVTNIFQTPSVIFIQDADKQSEMKRRVLCVFVRDRASVWTLAGEAAVLVNLK